jgi:hypothetical protein
MPTDAFCLTLGGFRRTGERMVAASGSEYWNEQKLREWLLLLLRFAITHEPSDRSTVLSIAYELDAARRRSGPSTLRFFVRTSCAMRSSDPVKNMQRRSLERTLPASMTVGSKQHLLRRSISNNKQWVSSRDHRNRAGVNHGRQGPRLVESLPKRVLTIGAYEFRRHSL